MISGLVGRSAGVKGIRVLAELRAKSATRSGDSVNGRGVFQSCRVVERHGYVWKQQEGK